MATGITVRCCRDAGCRQCTGKRLSRTIWSSFQKERMSYLCDSTVSGPTARGDNVLASQCDYPPFRSPLLNVPDSSMDTMSMSFAGDVFSRLGGTTKNAVKRLAKHFSFNKEWWLSPCLGIHVNEGGMLCSFLYSKMTNDAQARADLLLIHDLETKLEIRQREGGDFTKSGESHSSFRDNSWLSPGLRKLGPLQNRKTTPQAKYSKK